MTMWEAKGFFDFSVLETCFTEQEYASTVRHMYDLGYRTIAINQFVDDVSLEPKKKKKKGQPRDNTDIVPLPVELKIIEGCTDMKILNRLTVIFSSSDSLYKLIKSPNYKKYDIIAALPTTAAALMFTCGNFEADIITFDAENKLPVKYNRKIYNQLVDRGFYFEILYSPAIEDATKRKNTITVSHIFHTMGKSRNIIISSGAKNKMLIRNPYDIINLGLIFGLSEQQTKNAVTYCGAQLYKKSVGRCQGKSVMFVDTIEIEDSVINITDSEVLTVEDTSDEEMDVDEPAQKKSKS